jgi:hypothetical protein
MRQYRLRLIGIDGEARIEKVIEQPSLSAVWRELAVIAEALGRDGEFLRVIDECGEMVIRVGVATARSAAPETRRAA